MNSRRENNFKSLPLLSYLLPCDGKTIYSYVEKKYWNVSFMGYYSFNHVIPSFLFYWLIDSRLFGCLSNNLPRKQHTSSTCKAISPRAWLEFYSLFSPSRLSPPTLCNNSEYSNHYSNGVFKFPSPGMGAWTTIRRISNACSLRNYSLLATLLLCWHCCIFHVSPLDIVRE